MNMVRKSRGWGRPPRSLIGRLRLVSVSLPLCLLGLCGGCMGDHLTGGGDRPSSQPSATPLINAPDPATPSQFNPSQFNIDPQPYGRRSLDYFETIAFGSEFSQSSPVRRVRKWTKNLRISVQGQPTRQDRQTLNRIVDELNELVTRDGIRLELTETNPNVWILVVPHGKFAEYEPSYVPGNLGFFYTWWNGNMELVRTRILISSDRISQEERNHLIREELTQSLGLMNDSWAYQDSTFYQGWTRTQDYSDIDRDLVRILYDPRVKPGQTPAQVRRALR
ncbi:MAG: DUF2927 domain-containing protein [Cyanobacteria bacterium P01_C01_bin.89]